MVMVGVDSGSLYRRTHSLSRVAWSEGRQPLVAVLHLSNEPGELSQWLCHDDSTINIVLDIIVIITANSSMLPWHHVHFSPWQRDVEMALVAIAMSAVIECLH